MFITVDLKIFYKICTKYFYNFKNNLLNLNLVKTLITNYLSQSLEFENF
jgi:hypothetical protein